jgi:hypothetical protein
MWFMSKCGNNSRCNPEGGIHLERPIPIFCCYAPKDRKHLLNLRTCLADMKDRGLINLWADVDIQPGAEAESEIDRHLNSAEIVLLLISPDFVASDACRKQMRRAMERHEACVIPVLLRPVDRQGTPFAKLQPLPTDAVPVTSNTWHSQDEAWYDVAKGIRNVVQERLFSKSTFVPPALRNEIRDYRHYIEEKTRGFVGRRFVFDAVTTFTNTYPCGYYFIRGDPGIGKSALLAQMVKNNGYIHHFNMRSVGLNTTEQFLQNICAQVIVRYQLNYSSLPPGATRDSGFLKRILEEVSGKLGPREKAIIVVDALDEVDHGGLRPGMNILFLPSTLPQGIYCIVTLRRLEDLPLRIDDRKRDDTLEIEHDSRSNVADIRAYLERSIMWPRIQSYMAARRIDDEFFIACLADKSEGNFMYLHYVLLEIADGAYTDLDLQALPAGLQNYYEDHWRRMRGEDENKWFAYKLPVIMALTVVKEPVSIQLIVRFSGVQEQARVREVLHEWAQFLHHEQIPSGGELQKRYHLYHTSFHDFVASLEEVQDERVSLKDANRKIAQSMWSRIFEKEDDERDEGEGDEEGEDE